jgi:hypothetical protein
MQAITEDWLKCFKIINTNPKRIMRAANPLSFKAVFFKLAGTSNERPSRKKPIQKRKADTPTIR